MAMRGPINRLVVEILIAAGNRDVTKLLELLKIQEVRDKAADDLNHALQLAATFGLLSVVKELLTIQAVRDGAAALNNIVLGCILIYEDVELALDLLKIPSVRDNAAVDENHALHTAISRHLYPVVQELLKIPAVKQNLHVSKKFNISEKELNDMPLEILQEIQEILQPTFEKLSLPTGSSFSNLTRHIEENIDFYGYWSVLCGAISEKVLQSMTEASSSNQDCSLVEDDVPSPLITPRRSKRLMEARLAKQNQTEESNCYMAPKKARKR
ncbi:MAG: hypothetical protein HYX61_07725 [Gammaproteobacteria bacterium]|jgi:hypothetical protein|nr:hypothetical protein [Gammaproteobacteria bacterium]